ncbi:MAG: DUF5069 domain-containing protein [Nitrospinales bacterium]
MDLTQTYPRSPKETLAGLVHIPRMIDKARASANAALGEYIYPCPLDKIILDFLGVTAEEFAKNAEEKEDIPFSRWVEERCRGRNPAEIQSINRLILDRKPETETQRKTFLENVNKINPSRTDVHTWVNLIDLEEGRL